MSLILFSIDENIRVTNYSTSVNLSKYAYKHKFVCHPISLLVWIELSLVMLELYSDKKSSA